MNKPLSSLLIDTRQLQSLALDGPALSVTVRHQSARLFPLRRLARIHVVGNLQQGFEALLHCAENRIPVTFFTSRGTLRCQLYCPQSDNGILAHWLDHVEFDPQVQQAYHHWLEHQRLYLLSTLGYQRGSVATQHELVNQQLRSAINTLLTVRKIKDDAIAWLEGFLAAQLTQGITTHAMGRQCRSARRLLDDLMPLFITLLLHELATALHNNQRLTSNANGMSAFYHQHASAIDFHLQRMLLQLASKIEALV